MSGRPAPGLFEQNLRRRRRRFATDDRCRIYRAKHVGRPRRAPRWILEAYSSDPHEQVLLPNVYFRPEPTHLGIQRRPTVNLNDTREQLTYDTWRDAMAALAHLRTLRELRP